MARHALILAGGRGTRFWPRSRTLTPKQLLNLSGGRSLLEDTVERLAPMVPPDRVWILTNDYLKDAIAEQVPGAHVIAEPAQRNTAPCLGLAARIVGDADPSAVLGVFPADHYIAAADRFRDFAAAAYVAAETGKLITLGIRARWADTGYGYLEFSEGFDAGSLAPVRLAAFHEKPDAPTAATYVEAGRYFWNAGMFFWQPRAFLDALRQYEPGTAQPLASLPDWNDPSFATRLAEEYPRCVNRSVDHAVMESAARDGKVLGFATDEFGWNDLGSWNALYELDPATSHRTETLVHESGGCFVDAPGKLVALVGVKDLVVVEAGGVILVADRAKSQEVGKIVKQLEEQRRSDLL